MDLGIAGKKAIVCASSKGLGLACARALAEEGAEVVMTARTAATLEAAADEVRKATGATVTAVAGDITSEEGRAAALAACPQPDILVTNAGGPPAGDFRDWGYDEWVDALNSNMLTPIFLIKAVIDGMIARKFGRIVNITSGAVKSPLAILGLSNGARAGLTGFVAGLSRQVVEHNVTINGLLPGAFDTERLRQNFRDNAEFRGVTYEEMRESRRLANPAKRFGDPEEFGKMCAYLCGVHAGFINGQNLLLDGGAFNSTI
ncbi:MAG: SDR family oxidoreductase [Alphaproteobacteria bacterium]|nr:SDR family oxidoreductase [Alphaproteobacteria bacterium]